LCVEEFKRLRTIWASFFNIPLKMLTWGQGSVKNGRRSRNGGRQESRLVTA
jgi:hypothetical protein